MTDAIPDATRIEGAPHPRDTDTLIGQNRAEQDFLTAYATGRLHHAWMITGPRGVGKATLAWRIARFLLSEFPATPGSPALFAPDPVHTLHTDPDSAVTRRIRAGADQGVFELKRGLAGSGTALSQFIRIDELRKLRSFLFLSAPDGGRRVVIIDAVDDMNVQAANALLKLLEEPPERVTFLLISHQPARLLPTIRSRCRELRLSALSAPDMAQALDLAGIAIEGDEAPALRALANGSVGAAVRLVRLDGLAVYGTLTDMFANLPRLDRPKAIALAEGMSGKQNDARFELFLDLFDLFLSRLARSGIEGPPIPEAAPNESRILGRLAPNAAAAMKWAALHQTLGQRARHGKAVNLDPAALVMDMVLELTAAA